MFKPKQEEKLDGIDGERYEGVFLPVDVQKLNKDRRNIKDFLMESIENVLDEILEDLESSNEKK